MADDTADEDQEPEEEAPAVELGEAEPVEGAPIARIASRLTWPQEKSEVNRKVGNTLIRTPEGPQPLASILERGDTTYFARRQDFVTAVRETVGTGPIPTE